MDKRATKTAPQFSQPVRQIISMLIVLGLVGAGLYVGLAQVLAIFWTNPWLNGVIFGVFVYGVFSCFAQVVQLMYSVRWIESFARDGAKHEFAAPSLLAPLATLLRSRGERMHISSSSAGSILESVGQRSDEDREITRYIGNLLIFLGLLGTFYGLATTVPALVETIRSLNPGEGETGAEIFGRLQSGLEGQLGGMGTAFSSSLLGLAGSMVVGLLELFASHGQNRFYRELEEWLSTITRLGFAGSDDGSSDIGALSGFVDHMAEQMEAMQIMFTQSDISRAQLDDRLGELTGAMAHMVRDRPEDTTQNMLLTRVAEAQEKLLVKLQDSGMEGIDAESRMRLRSIDVQLLRLLEELTAGRQETVSELRKDISTLTRAVRLGQGRANDGGM